MKRAVSDDVIRLILIIIIFIVLLIILFNFFKALSYSGRLQAKFAYALSGTVDFLVVKPAQITQSVGQIGLYITAGILLAAVVIGGISAVRSKSTGYIEALEFAREELQAGRISKEQYKKYAEKILGKVEEESTLYKFSTGAKEGITYVVGNPYFQQLALTSAGLYVLGSVLNQVAKMIQGPLLYYLVPVGIVATNTTSIDPRDINRMYRDLNQTYVDKIEKTYKCSSNPTKSECQTIFLTYLIAKYLYNTFGETLGQAVSIAGVHTHYSITYLDYRGKEISLSSVFCMLYMMNYYDKNPFKQMYRTDIEKVADDSLVCNLLDLNNVGSCNNGGSVPDPINKMLYTQSYKVTDTDVQEYSLQKDAGCSTIIVPESKQSGIIGYIVYTYEGGSHSIFVTSFFQE
ncbi:MAG: hypothetical protein ACP5G1_02390 [Nanopusillaceae archaeon]